nr:zinc finger, CCHC-type [Tanacetum cinerariifolium]
LNKEPETYFFFFSFLLFNNANLNKVDEDMDAEFETIEARLQSFIGQFHSEVGVLDRIIHKYKNQHRRSSYFQYLFKVRRDCKLLQTTNLVELVNSSFLVSFSFWICIIIQEDETIDTFTGKLKTLVNKAVSLGHTSKDQTLVRKLLNVVPDRYLQIVASIEQYSDLSEMTMEEAIGRLKTYKERIKYKKGHIAPNCHQRTKANEQSNLIEEDLEPTLLMAILEDSDERNQVKEVLEQKVSLHEEEVGYKETNTNSQWYLDNGASNYMTGVREHFKEIDENING